MIAAVCYSLGPKPYIVYPVGELVSGLFVGSISTLVSAYLQTDHLNLSVILYSIIPMMMTVFLMSTNNTSDFLKDMGKRVTLPLVIGFRNSIKIIIPEALIMIAAWLMLYVIGSITLVMLVTGLLIFYYYGYVRWYKDYYHIQDVYPEMGREWGPRPLLLIYSFNLILSVEFFIYVLIQ